jgi:hypothetical protein
MTNDNQTTDDSRPAVACQVQRTVRPGSEALPQFEPVTLADVLDALNLFNRPKPSEDDGPWEGGHFIRVDHLPDFINIIAAAWFSPEPLRARISELEAAEDGAKEAFCVVVQQKHDAQHEAAHLRALLDSAHAQIHRMALRA